MDQPLRPTSTNVLHSAENKDIRQLEEYCRQGIDFTECEAALRYAIKDEQILDLFLKNGADPNVGAEDRRNRSLGDKGNGAFWPTREPSLLELAARISSPAVVKKLVSYGAKPQFGNVLHEAASVPYRMPSPEENNLWEYPRSCRDAAETSAIIKYLVEECGCNVNQNDDLNWHKTVGRPLHWAAQFPATEENLKLLIKYGANPDGRNINGRTPLDLAIKDDIASDEVKEILQHKEGEFSLPNSQYARNWYEPITGPKGSVTNDSSPESQPSLSTRIWDSTIGLMRGTK